MTRASSLRPPRVPVAADPHETARARLAAIEAAAVDAIVGATRSGRITDWNPAAERLFGYRADEAVGQSLGILLAPEQTHKIENLLARVRRGDRLDLAHAVRRVAAGPPVDVSLTIAPVCNAAGQVIAMSAIGRDVSPRDAVAAALTESEARFQAVLANASAGMALVRPDGGIFEVNPACCRILGYTAARLLGANIQDITHPDDLEASLALAQGALRGDFPTYETELRWLRLDGQAVWIRLNATLLRDAAGEARDFVLQFQEVAERKAQRKGPTAARRRTRDLLDRITDCVCGFDRTWRFTTVNAAAERLFGRPREELLGADVWQTFPEVASSSLYAACQRAMAEGVGANMEWHYAPTDAWFDVRLFPSADGLWAIFRDITATTRLSQDLFLSEARFKTLVEQLPAVVYALAADEAETPVYFSDAAEQMFGAKPSLLQARVGHWLDFVHPDDLERVKAKDEAAVEHGVRFEDEYRIQRPDGKYIWVQDACTAVRDSNGKAAGAIGLLLEVTKRKEMESELRATLDALEAANRAASQLLNMMNHQLRTPMQAVLGYADFLLAGGEGALSAGQGEDVGHIRQAAQRMIELIERMLTLARLEAGQMALVSAPVDLVPIVESVRQDVAPRAAAKGLTLLIDLPAALPSVLEILWACGRFCSISLTTPSSSPIGGRSGSVPTGPAMTSPWP